VGELLSDAGPRTHAEPDEGIRVNLIALAFPPLRSKLFRVFEVLWVVMVALRLRVNDCPLFDGDVQDAVVLGGYSPKVPVGRAVVPRCFELDPVKIGELLQVFVSDVFVRLDNRLNLLPQFLVDFRVSSEVIDHHSVET
jgi:hypothetical protein